MNSYMKCALKLLWAFLFLASPVVAEPVIKTIAGTGVQGFSGDHGPALAAQLWTPFDVQIDAAGNIYIADALNHRIRKIDNRGIIITIAGKNTAGFSGDGGPATSAELQFPASIALDADGNLYIADLYNQRIRKVTPAGIITTVAGNGTAGYSGDGDLAIYAALNSPSGVKVDGAGNIYIADKSNNRIRKVSPEGIITTVAGNGTPGYSGDGGAAISASLCYPSGVDVDAEGNIYIADTFNNRIRKVTPEGIITTVAGDGTAGFGGDGDLAVLAQLNYPSGVEVDVAGTLFIADTYNHRIRKVTPDGVITTVTGTGEPDYGGDGGPAAAAKLYGPVNTAMDPAGNLYIADTSNHRVRMVSESAGVAKYFPQIAIGGGYRTVITFGNNGSETSSGFLSFTDQAGRPFVVRGTLSLPGSAETVVTGSNFAITLPPASMGVLIADPVGQGEDIRTGWAKIVSSTGSVYGVARYQLTYQGELLYTVGVPTAQLVQNATIPIDDDYAEERLSAFAVANPTSQNLRLKIALVDQQGDVVVDNIMVNLSPGQQTAKYIYQQLSQTNFRFRGSVVLRAQEGGSFTAVALIQNQALFTAIPVASGKASHIPD